MNVNVGVDTQIITSDGYIKKIQDIKENESLLNSDGSSCDITSIEHIHENKTMYKIKQFNDGDDYIVDDLHIISLKLMKDIIMNVNDNLFCVTWFINNDMKSVTFKEIEHAVDFIKIIRNDEHDKKGRICNISLENYIKKSDEWKSCYKKIKHHVEITWEPTKIYNDEGVQVAISCAMENYEELDLSEYYRDESEICAEHEYSDHNDFKPIEYVPGGNCYDPYKNENNKNSRHPYIHGRFINFNCSEFRFSCNPFMSDNFLRCPLIDRYDYLAGILDNANCENIIKININNKKLLDKLIFIVQSLGFTIKKTSDDKINICAIFGKLSKIPTFINKLKDTYDESNLTYDIYVEKVQVESYYNIKIKSDEHKTLLSNGFTLI
jgi:hypothetical protein